MSIQARDLNGDLNYVAGLSNVDMILSPTSKSAIANKTVYNALATKIESTVENLVNFYNKSQVYNKQEVRELIGAINTLTIEVVNELPTQDISATTIYFLKQSGANTYDEYIYVDNAWVKIGDTDIDLSGYLTTANFQIAIADYYTKSAIDAMIANYYTKTQVDAMVDAKQDALTFDNAPTAGSDNPVKSGGIKTALDAKQNTLTFDSTPTANSSNPVTSNGIKTAIDAKKFSNPNLLDNPFFSVNSRGESVYAGEGTVSTYCVDRWSLYNWWASSSTTACVLNSDGTITLNNNTESSNRQFVQFIPFEYLRVGESYTASIDVVSITGSATLNMQQDTSPWTGVMFISSITSTGIKTGTKNWVEVTDTKVRFFISLAANTSITIRAMKLEKGPISTLNLDTVPNYATELAKCRASKADSTDTFANQGSYFLSADNAILGAKNLLPLTLSILKANTSGGTWTNNVYVKDGVTFTVSVDSSDFVTKINIDGTTSSNISNLIFNHNSRSKLFLEKGQYIISKGNTNASVQVYWNLYNNSTFIRQIASLTSTESKAVTIDYSDYNAYEIGIHIPANTTITNTDVYPMIRLATDTDSTYQPYAMTNRELTEKEQIQDISSNVVATIGTLSSATYIKKIGNVIYFKINISGLNLSANTWTDVVHITGESLFNGQLCTVCASDAYMGIGSIENANDGILIKAKLTQAITSSFLLLWGTAVVQ